MFIVFDEEVNNSTQKTLCVLHDNIEVDGFDFNFKTTVDFSLPTRLHIIC